MSTQSPFFEQARSAHPTLDWAVTPDQRARAEDYIQQAYATGRITSDDFDRRIGMAISATTRRELNAAFDGLATIPTEFPGAARPSSMALYGSSLPARPAEATGAGAAAHFLAPFTWLIGPGLVAAASTPGSPAHRQAAKAFNATLSFTVVAMVLGIVQHVVPGLHYVTGLVGVLWFVFMIVGGIKAIHGEKWTNPFSRVLPLKVLNEGPARR